ncbi:GTPase-activating protein [Lecanora helva]
MTSIFHDTGAGWLFGLNSKKEKPDLESSPSWWLRLQNRELSLKLESARIPAPARCAQRQATRAIEKVSSNESLSVASTFSNDSTANLKKCTAAECEMGWDGLDDPEVYLALPLKHVFVHRPQVTEILQNPLNFSTPKKALIEFLINILTVCVYLGTSILTPGIPSMITDLHTSQTVATLGTSVSLLGYAIGPMIWSPIAETPSIGRTPVYLVTLAIFVLIQLPIAMATNIETVLIFRFLSGVFGSPPQATGGATLTDIYEPRRRSYAIGLWELSGWAAPTLGPLLGAFAAQRGGWRWTVWELVLINCAMFLVLFCFLPETSPSNILYRRAKRLRTSVGSLPPRKPSEKKPLRQTTLAYVKHTLIRPFTLCFGEPICLVLHSYTALMTGLFFAWFETVPVVFTRVYSLGLVEIGLCSLGLLGGVSIAYLIFLVWFRCSESKKFDRNSRRKPEERFVPLMAGCVLVPLSLFTFGWTARKELTCLVPIVASGLFSIGSYSLFVSPQTCFCLDLIVADRNYRFRF